MKKVGIIKRVLAIGLIFLLSINSFAASTGANDGSAFITKAEFDSLKNNFQAQIDTYNQNIDSKIDSAISAYLSNISIARKAIVETIVKKDTKIKMLRKGDIEYKRGTISGSIDSCLFRGYEKYAASRPHSSFTNSKILLKEKNNSNGVNYDKMYVSAVDRSKKIADIYGFYKNDKENLDAFCLGLSDYPHNVIGFSGVTDPLYSTATITTGGIPWKLTNTDYSTKQTFVAVSVAFGSESGEFNFVIGSGSDPTFFVQTFQRTYGTKDDALFLIQNSIPFKRFVDFDHIAWNFSNDDDINNAKNLQKDLFELELSMKGMGGWDKPVNYTQTGNLDNKWQTDARKKAPLYEGFVNDILTDWNQLYNSQFDFIADSLTTSVIADSAGTKHLMCYAGLPIAYVQQGTSIEYELKFSETNKEYDLWIKEGPFACQNATNDSNVIKDAYAMRDGTKINMASGKNYLTVKSGDKLFLPAIKNDNYLFLKWRYKDDSNFGGGTMVSTGEITVNILDK